VSQQLTRFRDHVASEIGKIQPYGHLVNLPMALVESVRKHRVEHNHIAVRHIALRDLYKKHHWQVAAPTFYELHCCSTRTSTDKMN
jgi:starvation-inducible DNA-binding protein